MSKNVLSAFYFDCIMSIITIVVLIILLLLFFLGKPYDFAGRHPEYSEEYIASLQKTEQRVRLAGKILFSAGLAAMVLFVALPQLLDYRTFKREDYSQLTGEVTRIYPSENESKPRTILVTDETTGKEQRLRLFFSASQLEVGDVVVVRYLPCTEYAELVKIE